MLHKPCREIYNEIQFNRLCCKSELDQRVAERERERLLDREIDNVGKEASWKRGSREVYMSSQSSKSTISTGGSVRGGWGREDGEWKRARKADERGKGEETREREGMKRKVVEVGQGRK
ncbi:hypothetical protein Tco_0270820 [Tanacetum coccineum]